MPFQAILKAARNQDHQALDTILDRLEEERRNATAPYEGYRGIDQPGDNGLSAAEQLVREGNTPAVMFLLKHRANIDLVLNEISVAGNKTLFDQVYRHGRSSNEYAINTFLHINPIPENQTAQIIYLSHFTVPVMNEIISINNPRNWRVGHTPVVENRFLVQKSTQKKAEGLSKQIHQHHLSFEAALTKIDETCQGLLYLLIMINMKQNPQRLKVKPELPLEIWRHIFSFVTPAPVDNEKDSDRLQFIVSRQYLGAQLKSYESGYGFHKSRALSFFKAISHCGNEDEMKKEINEQAEVLQGRNPYKLLERSAEHRFNPENPRADRFHGIVGFWEEMYTGKAVNFEAPPIPPRLPLAYRLAKIESNRVASKRPEHPQVEPCSEPTRQYDCSR